MNTSDKNILDGESVFNIPVLFGDDFTYYNSSHNFQYINELAKLLKKYGESRYGP